MTPFIINQHNCYFYLTNELVDMMKGQELSNCRCFDSFEQFYNAVHELFPDVASVEELHGSYIELYYDDEIDKAVVEHSFLNAEFDIETLAQDISNYAGN
ncbi:hypothetical protein [Salmonella phage SE13]|uniref:Uncharacterized protein n=1 Tax=Salmonella phage SE13 TaxID=2575325 RepID=A0A513ZWP4_9CAUD|nr:hypothetical protein HWC19_gp08 [Salmonella phage SE13]QDH45114.1 hypothetical protein [Salmonella phage SE13]